jgi:hypothetical protein
MNVSQLLNNPNIVLTGPEEHNSKRSRPSAPSENMESDGNIVAMEK